MSAQLNLASDITSYINNVYEDAMFIARANNVMAQLVTTFSDRNDDAVRKSSEYNAVTMNSIGEGDDLASQEFTPSVLASLTPGEAGAQVFLSRRRINSDPFQVRTDAATELGMSLATKIETDLLANFASLTGGTLGAAGSASIWGYFLAAQTILNANKAPRPYYAVMHSYQWHPLAKAASVAGAQVVNAPQFQDSIMADFYLGSVGGVAVFQSPNIAIDANDDATYAVFSRQAIALDNRIPPTLEPEYDASRRGWELNMSALYATGVWRPTFGVKVTTDATAPAS